ncbi:zona pellucida sperm-binding protein 3 receptor-like [Clavelina lepadiformis]|uniref:zona pellucida sperm-binding protein 3 receptor-like n=1 Tax=Clavelina lepadiformis TaxID=159417 RepID=UPI00404132DD
MNDQQYNEAKEYCLSYGEDQSSNFAEGDSPMSTIADTASLARSIIIIDRPAPNNRLILERNPIRRIDEVSTVENDDFSNDSENLLSSSNSESQGEDAWTRLFENSCAKHRRKIILIVLVVMLGVAAAVMFGLILRTHGSTYNHTCKKLKSPPNGGSIACKKNACKFTCPAGSRLMINASCPGKNTTVCETVGTSVPFWTNPVPYCEKVICCRTLRPSVGVSSNSSCSFDGETTVLHSGEVYSMFQNGTKCTVLCQPTYVIKGFPEVTCATTSLWQPDFPSCQEKECPDIRPSDFLSYTCTNKNKIGSVCKFLCSQGRHILGPTSITCETSMNWSSLPPKCQSSCPPCMTGPDCKHIKSWNKLKDDIVDKPWAKFIAIYAGYSITCKINKHGGVFNFNWDCTCTDLSTSYQHRCNDYKSPGGSCKHALAFLVKDMVRKGVYPEPCDTSEMPYDCN